MSDVLAVLEHGVLDLFRRRRVVSEQDVLSHFSPELHPFVRGVLNRLRSRGFIRVNEQQGVYEVVV